MSLQLTREGRKSITKLDKITKLAPDLAFRILTELGADGVKETTLRTPIDTAAMVSTVRMEKNKKFLKVKILIGGIWARFTHGGSKRKFVDYPQYVEEGTRKIRGVHMLTRGVTVSINKRFSIAKVALNNWIAVIKRN